jgi:hypothetical protein
MKAAPAVPLPDDSNRSVTADSTHIDQFISKVTEPVGTLTINLDESAQLDPASVPSNSKLLASSKIAKKTTNVGARKIGAKKLSTGVDIKLESFEAVEKRTQTIEEKSTKLTGTEDSNSGGSGRVAAAYVEAESIYRVANTPSTVSPYGSLRSPGNTSSNYAYGSKGNAIPNETYSAREKYGNAKSISSDQYFGNDREDDTTVRAKLEKFSGSSAISSDMLYSDASDNSDNRNFINRSESANIDLSEGIGKLKSSVKGFFDDIQKRIS